MIRRLLIALGLTVLVACAVWLLMGVFLRSDDPKTARGHAPSASKPPNVLIVTMDTTRADHLGCYGYDGVRTPNIDAVAREGVLFEEAFSVQPVTLPAHASIFTGQYPFRHGVRDNNYFRLSGESATLAEMLQDAGYLTTAFVASYVLDRQFGLDQGFEYYNDRFIRPKRKGRLPVDRRASEVSFLAAEWLEELKDEIAKKPFFLWLHYYDPHADYDPPHPYRTAYGNPYDGEIAYMDDWLGFFFKELRRRGLWENTIVVLVADHGEGLGDQGEKTHGMFIYRSTTRVPLIIKYPSQLPRGVRVKQRVSTVDILPTVLELLRIEVDEELDGITLRDIIAGRPTIEERPVYSETHIPRSFHWSELKGVRRGDWFYIDAPKPELYSIGNDTDQNVHEEHAERAGEMKRVISQMIADSGEPSAEPVAIGSEMVERLRALGYFVGAGENMTIDLDSPPPDPKDSIDSFNKYQRAVNLIAAEAYDSAVSLLERIVAADPGNPRFRMELGDALLRQGRFGEAEQHLRYIVDAWPGDSRYHFLLGKCYLEWGKIEPAQSELERTIVLNPGHFLARFHLGLIHIGAEEWERAERSFQGARRLKPRDPRTLNNLGYLAIRARGDYKSGIELIEKALAANPGDVEILGSLGSAYLNSGEFASAEKHLTAALDLVPDRITLIDDLIALYQSTGEQRKARELAARKSLIQKR